MLTKGKANKKYEFGCKVAFVTTSKSNWMIGVQRITAIPMTGRRKTSSQSLFSSRWQACSLSMTVLSPFEARLFQGELSIEMLGLIGCLRNKVNPIEESFRREREELEARTEELTTGLIWLINHCECA